MRDVKSMGMHVRAARAAVLVVRLQPHHHTQSLSDTPLCKLTLQSAWARTCAPSAGAVGMALTKSSLFVTPRSMMSVGPGTSPSKARTLKVATGPANATVSKLKSNGSVA